MRPMQRFIVFWLISLVVFLGIVIGVNVLVDPYGIIGAPRIAGFNQDKMAAVDWPRVTKPYLVVRANPATLVMGTSPADVAFDPASADWPADLKPVFNLSIDGSSPHQMYRFEQDALAVSKPKLVVISISLEDSQVSGDPPKQPEDFDQRLRVSYDGTPNPDHRLGVLNDYIFATASFKAIGDSLRTIIHQRDPIKTFQTPLGQLSGGKFEIWARNEGFHVLVSDKDHLHAGMDLRWARKPRFDIERLIDMIKVARDHGANVTVVIIPNYIDQLEIRRQTGLTGQYNAWKTRVVELADQAKATMGGVTLWDFSGFSPYVTEPLPEPGDRSTRLHWFWESIHFQPALGNLIIQKIMGKGPEDFGVLLTTDNLAADIASYHEAQDRWVVAHPRDVARITRFIGEANCTDHPEACGKAFTPIAGPEAALKTGTQ
ncbi:MAG: hypothetical protein JWM91_1906 [Rhodospirillales bacterium]|nr:hypothetical protein [Rhodospirillales bacterium]